MADGQSSSPGRFVQLETGLDEPDGVGAGGSTEAWKSNNKN